MGTLILTDLPRRCCNVKRSKSRRVSIEFLSDTVSITGGKRRSEDMLPQRAGADQDANLVSIA